MGHNKRFKPGPTLAEAKKDGATHVVLHCHGYGCHRQSDVVIIECKAPDHIPVNKLPWRCGSCRGIDISVSLKFADRIEVIEVLDVKDIKPKRRRMVRAG